MVSNVYEMSNGRESMEKTYFFIFNISISSTENDESVGVIFILQSATVGTSHELHELHELHANSNKKGESCKQHSGGDTDHVGIVSACM